MSYRPFQQVATSAQQLSASSEQTTQTTHQISAAIQEVANGADTQLQGSIHSSNSVKELTKGIDRVVETVSEISLHSSKTQKEVYRFRKQRIKWNRLICPLKILLKLLNN